LNEDIAHPQETKKGMGQIRELGGSIISHNTMRPKFGGKEASLSIILLLPKPKKETLITHNIHIEFSIKTSN
jgi:hypothetical protein